MHYVGGMKQSLRHITFVALILPAAVFAEDAPSVVPQDQTEVPFVDGLDLLRGGAELLMQDLFDQLGPALKGLEDFALELDAYEAPVVLPNGDILIRRKTPDEGRGAPQAPHKLPDTNPTQSDDIEL